MSHHNKETWLKYINNTLPENERENLEQHMYSCDLCLEHYLEALEKQSNHGPQLQVSAEWTESILLKVPVKRKQPSQKQQLIHYAIAAVATIILMASGAFQAVVSIVPTKQLDYEEEVSISKSLIEQISILRIIEKNKEGQ
ncbi:anti-sigma factor family protein [Bacillus alkalicellulosilyticus]|uniref:anti-sigma factor family protein n=1 Tax=Alkalihalobacterium alkalicellulosilyticum TaxID=1912214 RepID=UPI000996AE4E|nr:hypothetical protein [Bacillus alkalicellulosilyticus]